jgi:hypothetical protein
MLGPAIDKTIRPVHFSPRHAAEESACYTCNFIADLCFRGECRHRGVRHKFPLNHPHAVSRRILGSDHNQAERLFFEEGQ